MLSLKVRKLKINFNLFLILFLALAVRFVLDKDYDKAIELYTKAIEIDPLNAVYYANRSLANLRQESFGYALNDAISSMKTDPGYLKAYYRRAAAHMSLGKFKLALSDFELVAKRRPNDADAKKKFVECNKIVKKLAFERAIAVDRPEKTLAEMYQSLESISIEDDYDGPKLDEEKNVTLEFMKGLMEHYKDQKKLHKKYAYKVSSTALPSPTSLTCPALSDSLRHGCLLTQTTFARRRENSRRRQVHRLR